MNRRDVTRFLGLGFITFLGGKRFQWKPESPKAVRKLEKNVGGDWQAIEFDNIKTGDRFRIVGEPGFIYTALGDAQIRGSVETDFIMVGKMERNER